MLVFVYYKTSVKKTFWRRVFLKMGEIILWNMKQRIKSVTIKMLSITFQLCAESL